MMISFTLEDSATRAHYDHWLIACVFVLTGTGLVTLYSASFNFAARYFKGDSWYFVRNQAIFASLGLAAFFVAARARLESLRKFVMPMVLFTMALCALTFIPHVGVSRNGARRWIHVGSYTYQPSELVKIVLPFYLAHIFDKKKDQVRNLTSGVLPQFCIVIIFFLLIYAQNNFSTAVFITLNALVIFFLAGVRIWHFISAAAVFLPVAALLVLTKEHRLRRLISFLWPDWEPLGAGYQVASSVLTIESGGFWGKGIGQGTRKIASVPEIHSDFVFSAFSEEAGFVGVVAIIAIFVFFLWRALRTALYAKTVFTRLLVFGLITIIFTQAMANLAVVSGLIPATGVPLPFFSAGGSSLATTLLACGIIVNVSREASYE
jgi:cell division protein FtsW